MPAASYGRNQFQASSGIPIRLTADGLPEWRTGGISIAWPLVAIPGSPVVLASEQLTIPTGAQYLQCGQVMVKCTSGTYLGQFGPYDFAATDGRQTLVRGDTVLLDKTLILNGILGFTVSNNTVVGGIEGGEVYFDSIIQSGVGTASLAAGPTLAALEAALPRLRYAKLS